MPKRLSNPKHLRFIRGLPCAICGRPDSEAHHLLRGPVRGMGLKAGDDWTIPLCSAHHRGLHADGNEVRYLGDINGPALAAALWQASGDDLAGLRAIVGATDAQDREDHSGSGSGARAV